MYIHLNEINQHHHTKKTKLPSMAVCQSSVGCIDITRALAMLNKTIMSKETIISAIFVASVLLYKVLISMMSECIEATDRYSGG